MDETQNNAPFVAFYDMHAVTFVPPDQDFMVIYILVKCSADRLKIVDARE